MGGQDLKITQWLMRVNKTKKRMSKSQILFEKFFSNLKLVW